MKIKIRIIALIATFSVCVSCNDVLDLEPLSAPSSANVLSNAAEVQLALNSAYIHTGITFNFCCGAEYSGVMALDEFTDIAWNRSNGGIQAIGEGNMRNDLGILENYWNNFYNGIGKANYILDNLDRATDNVEQVQLDQFEGEALFLRAYYYYYLATLFGDVVLHTASPDASGASNFPLTEQAVVLSQVSEDISAAVSLLSEDKVSPNTANKFAALALQARVALYQEDYALAASSAKEVIDNGGYSLYADYRELFTHIAEGNDETIFSYGYSREVQNRNHGLVQLLGPRRSGGDGWSIDIPTRQLVDSYETVNGLPIDEDPAFDPLKPFENRDPRLKASIFTNGNVDTYYDPDFTFYVEPGFGTPDVTSNAASFSGFVWKKYIDAEGLADRRNIGVDIMLFRLAEMYLIYAEASIESGSDIAGAVDALNTVRARAYQGMDFPEVTTTSIDDLRKILRRERKVELAGEGLRLIDIRRWRIAEEVMPGAIYGRPLTEEAWQNSLQTPTIDENGRATYANATPFERAMGAGFRVFDSDVDYFWLIPLSEIDANEALQ